MINWNQRLTQRGLIWRYPGDGPHAAFSLNDSHSDFYFNSDCLISDPALLREACKEIFIQTKNQISKKPDWIITCPPHGLNVGFCLAELFDCNFGYIKSLQEPEIYFDLKTEETVLVCADDLISGASIAKIFNALANKGIKPTGPLMVIANWGDQASFNGFDAVSLIHEKANIWSPSDCPLCQSGSEAIPARQRWLELSKGQL